MDGGQDAFPGTAPPEPLTAALGALRWIESAAEEDESGTWWRRRPEETDAAGPGDGLYDGLYDGTAGIVLALLHVAEVTGDASLLRQARAGARTLTARWADPRGREVPIEHWNLTLLHGRAGIAYVLTELARVTGDEVYRDTAAEAVESIVTAARRSGTGAKWTGQPAVAADSGIVLFLLYAAVVLGEPAWLETAAAAGECLLALAERDARGGSRWWGFTVSPTPVYRPNFLEGTAGIAYTLARLADVTGDGRFLAAARAGADHLGAIATVRGDAALVHLLEPGEESLYYLGYCNGPVGTARLFHTLHRQTGEARYGEWTERLAAGIVRAGALDRRSPGLWNVDSQCCGLAGILDFFLGLWSVTGAASHLGHARAAGRRLLARATTPDGHGYRWHQALSRSKPGEVTADTGYFTGAAGIATALLHLHHADQGRYVPFALPDNPFTGSGRPIKADFRKGPDIDRRKTKPAIGDELAAPQAVDAQES
jgi:hypothetical protein